MNGTKVPQIQLRAIKPCAVKYECAVHLTMNVHLSLAAYTHLIVVTNSFTTLDKIKKRLQN